MKVIFDDFSLKYYTPCDDVLQFYSGTNARATRLGSYCGTTHPEVLFSTGRALYVRFYANVYYTVSKFTIRFSAVKRGTVMIYSLQLFDVWKPL